MNTLRIVSFASLAVALVVVGLRANTESLSAEYLLETAQPLRYNLGIDGNLQVGGLRMAQPQPEKRSVRRFALHLPISVNFLNDGKYELTGHTRDVSSRGVFIYVSTEIAKGATMEFVMTLPPEVTLSSPLRVRCSGRVLRVEKDSGQQGIAVAIEQYDFLGEE